MLQLSTVEFAGFTIQNPVIGFPLKKGKGIKPGKNRAGNLGNIFLKNFVLYLDYKREQVIVEKGKNFNNQFPTDKSGLQLKFSPKKEVEVLWASPSTPAAVAGFQKGDIIKSINNSPVESFKGLNDIQRLFQEKPGTQYEFQVFRNGQVIEIQLTLEALFKKDT
jgi:membrane-associated protease RseP (regulator of RpoE activity)